MQKKNRSCNYSQHFRHSYEPGKLVLAEHHELATQLGDDLALVLRLAMLQYVLDHVVTILVMNQVLRLLM